MRLYFIPPLQALVAAFIIWLLANSVTPMPIPLPGTAIAGAVLIAIGLGFDVLSAIRFMQHKTTVSPVNPERTEHLVTDGLYRFSRNPMYLGLFLILTGFALRQNHLLGLLVPFGFVIIITRLQIIPEEVVLRAKFGEAYDDYCNRVRRWI